MKNYILYIKKQGDSHYLTEYEIVNKNYNLEINQIPEDWNKEVGVPGDTKQIDLLKDEYFLLCDNRISSVDSRFFGPIQNNRIAGKVICRYFPFSSISAF
jgi:signal peptidase I